MYRVKKGEVIMNLDNCPVCGGLFLKTKFRDICEKCYKEEEEAFEVVYNFLRKRENRMATITQVVEATGVEEALLFKFIKTGRLQLRQFPHLGYPCARCGTIIREGKLCESCNKDVNKQLHMIYEEEKRKDKQNNNPTYYIKKDEK